MSTAMMSSNSFHLIYNSIANVPVTIVMFICIHVLPDEFLCIQMFSLPGGNRQCIRSHFDDILSRFNQTRSVQFSNVFFFYFLIFRSFCPLTNSIDSLTECLSIRYESCHFNLSFVHFHFLICSPHLCVLNGFSGANCNKITTIYFGIFKCKFPNVSFCAFYYYVIRK